MKNIIICVLVGVSFLTSGFWVGLRFAPMPKKPAPVAATANPAATPVATREAFSLDSLKRTSENMLSINDALQAREQAVAVRESKVAQQEDELTAERAAMDRLHARFHELYSEFQKRLQLVTDTETGALQRQVVIYSSMDPAQAVDLVRTLDDSTVTRLFVLMEDKPLAKIVSAWKQKYPAETPRLLADLNDMGRVVAKDKIDLPDAQPAEDGATPAPPASTDVNAPASDAATPAPAPETTTAGSDASAPAPVPDASATPASANDPGAPAAPAPADGSISGHEPYMNAGTPPPDLANPNSPASIPDAPAPAAPSAPSSDTAAPPDAAAPPSDSTAPAPAAPTQDAAPAPANDSSTAAPASASAAPESPLMTSPGETAAKAAAASQSRPDNDNTSAPSEFTPTTPTTRPAHDKSMRFASARNN